VDGAGWMTKKTSDMSQHNCRRRALCKHGHHLCTYTRQTFAFGNRVDVGQDTHREERLEQQTQVWSIFCLVEAPGACYRQNEPPVACPDSNWPSAFVAESVTERAREGEGNKGRCYFNITISNKHAYVVPMPYQPHLLSFLPAE